MKIEKVPLAINTSKRIKECERIIEYLRSDGLKVNVGAGAFNMITVDAGNNNGDPYSYYARAFIQCIIAHTQTEILQLRTTLQYFFTNKDTNMKYENLDKAVVLSSQIGKILTLLENLDSLNLHVKIMDGQNLIATIGVGSSFEHEFSTGAVDFIQKMKEHYNNRLTKLYEELEVL